MRAQNGERPRSRQTVIAGAITIALIALIAAIWLLYSTPWNDPGGRPHSPTPTRSAPITMHGF